MLASGRGQRNIELIKEIVAVFPVGVNPKKTHNAPLNKVKILGFPLQKIRYRIDFLIVPKKRTRNKQFFPQLF